MNITSRARVHAALGDATRLRIADALALGDLTVSELGDLTGTPSNLLAHHLDTLERADIIERRVSEGDRRRRYVVLVRGTAAGVGISAGHVAETPLFVCTHNSARSPFAAGLWRIRTGGQPQSAGTEPVPYVHPTAVDVAADFGVDLSTAVPHGYDAVTITPDAVISVCDRAGEAPVPFDALHIHWSIPDPVTADSREAFVRAFGEISERIDSALGRAVA